MFFFMEVEWKKYWSSEKYDKYDKISDFLRLGFNLGQILTFLIKKVCNTTTTYSQRYMKRVAL